MPFEDEERQPKKKISLRQDKMPISSVPVSENKANVQKNRELEKGAREYLSQMDKYNAEMFELASSFKGLVNDQILPENKSPIAISLEKELINKLASLSSEMNRDDEQPECAGSDALCLLLMKCLTWQRDSINKLSYDLSRMHLRVSQLENPSVDKKNVE